MPVTKMITNILWTGSDTSDPLVTMTVDGFQAQYARASLFLSELSIGAITMPLWASINPWYAQYSVLNGGVLETKSLDAGTTKTFAVQNLVSVTAVAEFDWPTSGAVFSQLVFWS